ncbi:DUF6456 domain-containing protein [Parvibaculum sp.]|jgi:hypothetical protein|uniref:DUF6456 domain-containing protein n=1 Tax=Parvibaculum sp. TaxID=2024848 RepID=UPI00391C8A42
MTDGTTGDGATPDRFLDQHRIMTRRTIRMGAENTEADINEGESPLGWLRHRKGRDGKPLLSDVQFEAGERLRRDFTFGLMMPRLTADWDSPIRHGRAAPRDPGDLTVQALAARERVGHALKAVGPGLSDILIGVCCHLQGLEEAERNLCWPKRAGKLVLQIALDRLADHYGIGKARQAVAAPRAARASA